MPLTSQTQQSPTAPEQTCTDALLLRNYEGATAVSIDVAVSDDGQPVHETTVTLDPLTIESVDLPIAPGEYCVTALIDESQAAATCTLGDEPTALAFVEAGNGVVSVVDEAY
jgi:hypothetical protein